METRTEERPIEVIPDRRHWYRKDRRYSVVDGESMTQQSHAQGADVNYIVNRYQRTGELPKNPRGQEGVFDDVTGLQVELTEAYNKAKADLDAFYESQKAQDLRNKDDSWEQQEREDLARGDAPPTTTPDKTRSAGGEADARGSA